MSDYVSLLLVSLCVSMTMYQHQNNMNKKYFSNTLPASFIQKKQPLKTSGNDHYERILHHETLNEDRLSRRISLDQICEHLAAWLSNNLLTTNKREDQKFLDGITKYNIYEQHRKEKTYPP